MITLGNIASASSNYPAKPGIKGINITTLNFFFSIIAFSILLIKDFATRFFNTFYP